MLLNRKEKRRARAEVVHGGSNGELAHQKQRESTNTDADSRVRASVSPRISSKEGAEEGGRFGKGKGQERERESSYS